jgi:hypothetical protein
MKTASVGAKIATNKPTRATVLTIAYERRQPATGSQPTPAHIRY